ncbi:NAD(P)-dependent oxidoreductase [Bombilactobacillus thymidiniphilus]|uniref:NAD(P)H-binding protein n=1 Tax=Bombilactobacillus thymidiniphilus TaxID=2923363 RepID=A0ABY4PD43_9LACO|nr:NAD(P)H-binding protein [Bombilactobacillus thymidiniphilus]UQS83689.1 NAD(P)H-binding protein [Bombilactobacillus thymidiniphilus]
MKILIIGATGMAGSALVKQAVAHGHEVTGISRSKADLTALKEQITSDLFTILAGDAFALTKADLKLFDVVIDAFGTAPQTAYLHVDLATHLVAQLRELSKPRLGFILGAGSLTTGSDKHLFVKDMQNDPQNASFIAIPENQLAELQFLQNIDNVDWFGISPGVLFQAGAATKYLLGHDDLLYNDLGKSQTSSETMAQVVLSEIEDPKHHQERFTVINA